MTASILAIVGTLLAIVWWFIQNNDARKKKYEEAKRDLQKAIDAGDASGVLSAQRKLQIYR
jgi:hypothetical protein